MIQIGQNIYLLGFMGSGKSHIGYHLSERIGFGWIDLDELIIQRNQMSVAQIFSNYGENYFRKEEREALHSTQHLDKCIISTGGGTPCFFDNMAWINRHGLSVFIDPSIPILIQRLLPGREKRPLIKNKSEAELESFISKKLEERRPFYEKARIHLQQEDINVEGVDILLDLLKKDIES